jgi:SAM-dependent methyltransferase
MQQPQIRFDDGAAYEEFMGKWSRLAGDTFLRWLAPPDRWCWVDVGCGNGAFTEMLVDRCAATQVEGIDPSAEQLAFARERLATRPVRFQVGDAMALPYVSAEFDAAVMALVIFFVPDPAKAVAEMARVVRPAAVCRATPGHPRRRLSVPRAPGGNERARAGTDLAAERRGLAHGDIACPLVRGRTGANRDARDQRRANLRRLRHVLADRPDRPPAPASHRRHVAGGAAAVAGPAACPAGARRERPHHVQRAR